MLTYFRGNELIVRMHISIDIKKTFNSLMSGLDDDDYCYYRNRYNVIAHYAYVMFYTHAFVGGGGYGFCHNGFA